MFGDPIKRHPDVAVIGQVEQGKPVTLLASTSLPFGTLAVRNVIAGEGRFPIQQGRPPLANQAVVQFGLITNGADTVTVNVSNILGGPSNTCVLTTTAAGGAGAAFPAGFLTLVASAVAGLSGVNTCTVAGGTNAITITATDGLNCFAVGGVTGAAPTNTTTVMSCTDLPWGIVCQSQAVGLPYPVQFWGETSTVATNTFGYPQGMPAAILKQGTVWALPESTSSSIQIDQQIFARFMPSTANPNSPNGVLRNDSDGGTAMLVTGSYFDSAIAQENFLVSNSLGVTNEISITTYGSGIVRATLNRPQ